MIEKRSGASSLFKFEIQRVIEKGFEVFDLNSADYYSMLDLLEFSKIESKEKLKCLATILLSLFSSLKDGSLCLKLDYEVIKNKLNLITENYDDSSRTFENFLKDIQRYNEIISISINEYKPIIYQKYNGTPYLYFQKYFASEQRLKNNIDKILIGKYDLDPSKIDKEIIQIIDSSDLNDKQRIAVFLSLIKNFVIISGGPGTGKTYLIYWLLKILIRYGFDAERIRLAAPTGRAAERLTESIKKLLKNKDDGFKKPMISLEGETIHRLLKYSYYKNNFTYNEKNRLPIDVLIIDEVSMVDVNLMSRLLNALKADTKIIFLGDKDQLPSVEAGAVLADIIPNDYEESFSTLVKVIDSKISASGQMTRMTDRIVILNQNYRSKGSAYKYALEINKQNNKIIDEMQRLSIDEYLSMYPTIDDNCFFIEQEKIGYKNLHLLLNVWVKKHFFNDKINYLSLVDKLSKSGISDNNQKELLMKIFDIISRVKILAILKEGPLGAKRINVILEKLFREKSELFNEKIFSGMPIIITKNDYSLKLFNGDTGIILKDKSNVFYAVFNKGDLFMIIPINFLRSYECAFSITVHKSQGSEYEHILIILSENENNPLLTKELLYTALTRAKESVAIFGKKEIFEKAVSKKIVRESGLSLFE